MIKIGPILACVAFLTAGIASPSNECGLIVPHGFEQNADVQHTGYYFHPDHCFSVVIPSGVVGRTSSQPSSQHGFGALLFPIGSSYLYVGADPGSWLDQDESPRSLEKAANLQRKRLPEEGAVILKEKLMHMKLGPLPAARLVVTYKCPTEADRIVRDSIFALDAGGAFFEITLEAKGPAYKRARVIQDEVAKSWKLELEKCEEGFRKRLRNNSAVGRPDSSMCFLENL